MSKYLQAMMAIQRDMEVRVYGHDFDNMTDVDKMDFLRTNVLALEDELHEALAETGWKPWATSNHINREAFIGEMVDAFHFFMNLLILVDTQPGEFYERYLEKQQRNVKRQEAGYDGVTGKCVRCHRALDDDLQEALMPSDVTLCAECR